MQLIVLSNRRDRYLEAALDSIDEHVRGVTQTTIVDDSGDARWRHTLSYLDAEVISVAPEPAGYTRAMAQVFRAAEGEHVALWEEDFIATAPIDLQRMADMLDERPYLSEIVCQRTAYFPYEVAAGGIVQDNEARGHRFELVGGVLEHRAFWSTNPCVIPRRTLEQPYPLCQWSEAAFGEQLRVDPAMRFGLLPEISVQHVGERDGIGY